MSSISNADAIGNSTVAFTWFDRKDAPVGRRGEILWPALCDWIDENSPTAATKGGLPLIKLATFTGDYRNDANVDSVQGIEGDYDAELIQPDSAAAMLRAAGIEAFIYTSPSHRPDKPRWRVLAPLSRAVGPADRHSLLARVNGALGGILASESFTPAQAYYVGSTVDGAPVQCWRIDGRRVDTVDGLTPLGPPQSSGDGTRKPIGTMRAVSLAVLAEALACIEPHELAYPDWLRATAAYRGAGGDRLQWDEWCSQHPKNNLRDNDKLWRSFDGGTSVGWPALLAMCPYNSRARLSGLAATDSIVMAKALFGAVPAIPPIPAGARLPGAARHVRPANDPGSFFRLVSDIVPRDPTFLVDGLIEEDSTSIIFGDPGTGKSLVAIDLSASIATGTAFHHRRVLCGAVFYIAGEGMNGLRRRFAAWEAVRGVSLNGAALFQSRAAAQMLDDQSAAMVMDAVEKMVRDYGPPRLIVLDTLARNFGPGDENSTQDMNRFVAAMDRLRERFAGSSVLIVHHSGHGEKGRARGSSVLKAAADSEYLVTRVEGALHLTCSKMKEADIPPVQAFTLCPAAGSVALEYAGEPTAKVKLTKMNSIALEALSAAMVDGRATKDAWRATFKERHDGNDDAKKTAFRRAIDDLMESGAIVANDDGTYSYPPMPGLATR
jgi:AAA domain/Primase C terminal 2 (PriCT-2)